MEIVGIIERLGSFGLLCLLLWYTATRIMPRTVDAFRDALRENTATMKAGLHKASEALGEVLTETRLSRDENSAAHRAIAEVLAGIQKSLESHQVGEESRMADLQKLMERVLNKP